MSLCRTCEYALYDGMCLAHGKFTLLDAPACDDYKMHLDVEVSKLKAENAKLREMVARLIACVDSISNSDTFYYQPMRDGCGIGCTANGEHCSLVKMCGQARGLGVEVEE